MFINTSWAKGKSKSRYKENILFKKEKVKLKKGKLTSDAWFHSKLVKITRKKYITHKVKI